MSVVDRTQRPWLAVYEQGHVPAELDLYSGSLADLFAEKVREHADKIALTFYGRELTFTQLGDLVDRTTTHLAALGVRKGDRIGLMLPNCPHYVIAFFASMRLGLVVTQVNPLYVEREIEHILRDSGATTIVVYEDMLDRVRAVRSHTALANVVVVGFKGESHGLREDEITFDSLLGAVTSPVDTTPVDPETDVATLQYTGGTTGISKGAMLTHRNLAANLQQLQAFFIDDPDAFAHNETVIAVLPFFHIYGLTCVMLVGVSMGLNQILVPKFDVQEVLALVRDRHPVTFSAVPTMYTALNAAEDLEEYGFNRIRTLGSGGAPMPLELLRTFEARAGRPLNEGYGLSEASPVTHYNPPFAERKAGSVGIPVPSTEVRIVDAETGMRDMPSGDAGEVVIRGPQVMKGYWNMPDETALALRDGWLFTGDIGRMDDDGYFYIVDRKKDMILASGFNVYPRDVEEVLYEHPAVLEAVVVGVPDAYRGETVKAFVVPRDGAEVTAEQLEAFCRERLTPYKVPRQIEFRDSLPKSTVGKILRRVLAQEERARVPGS